MRRVGAAASTFDLLVIVIEFKAPHLVYGVRDSGFHRNDVSPDSIAMTKRLQTYAALWKCPKLILMDEMMTWFFYITGAHLRDPNSRIHCICATAPSPAATLTVRPSPSITPASSTPPSVSHFRRPSKGNSVAAGGSYTTDTASKVANTSDYAGSTVSTSTTSHVVGDLLLRTMEKGSYPSSAPFESTITSTNITVHELNTFATWFSLSSDDPDVPVRKEFLLTTTFHPFLYIPPFPTLPPRAGGQNTTSRRPYPQRSRTSPSFFATPYSAGAEKSQHPTTSSPTVSFPPTALCNHHILRHLQPKI